MSRGTGKRRGSAEKRERSGAGGKERVVRRKQ
jgi:hypothetical protein